MSDIRISFVIPARNEEALIGEVLEAILASVARAAGRDRNDLWLPDTSVEVIVVTELQGLRDPPVEHATPGRRDMLVCDLANAVVAEVVPVEPVLPDDAPPPQLIETVHEVGLIQVG